MNTKLLSIAILFIIFNLSMVNSQVPARTGWWKFDDPTNMLKAETGTPLELTGTMESSDGPVENNLAVLIGTGSYLKMVHGILPNGGGEKVNEYSIQIDFNIPEGGVYHSLLQLTPENTDDGDLFTNKSDQVGIWEAGYSDSAVVPGNWYRMILTVKNGEIFRIYMNGYLWRDATPRDIDSRYSLAESLLLFADEDGEDPFILCSEVGIWDIALTGDEVEQLGNAEGSASGIYSRNPNFGSMGQPYPIPAMETITFPYNLEKACKIQFTVTDLSGRIFQFVDEGERLPGQYYLRLNASDFKPGLYMVQMSSGNENQTKKMLISR